MNIFRTLLVFGILQINSCQIDNNYGNVIRQALEIALQFQSSFGVQVENFNFGNVQNIIMSEASKLLPSILDSVGRNISSSCLDDLEAFLQAFLRRDDWALRMLDAYGKPASGILEGHITWLGNFDECVSINMESPDKMNLKDGVRPNSSFIGKYCLLSVPISDEINSLTGQLMFSLGTCLPNTCSADDVKGLVTSFSSILPSNMTVPPASVVCQENTIPLTDAAIAVIVVCSIFSAVIFAATLYDVIIQNAASTDELAGNLQISSENVKRKEVKDGANSHVENNKLKRTGIFGRLLLSFSLHRNVPKLLNTKQTTGTLTCVNGIRFISTSWVILCHTYMMGLPVLGNAATFLPKMLKRFTFQAVINAFVSVDTFFILSGMLVAFLSLREMKKVGGPKKFNWFLFYFHRFWRLTPPYMLIFMLYVTTFKYWGDGPIWLQQGLDKNDCKSTWWTNLLYINNIVHENEACMGWSWYLANDMQFYVISPCMLVPLFYSPILGSLSCLAFIMVSVVSRGLISKHYEFNANLLFSTDMDDIFEIYFKPWSRIGPYVVGIYTGYLLYKTECKIKFSKVINCVGWMLATCVAIAVVYGLYTPDGSTDKLNTDMSALYNATSRIAWSLSVAWVILSCASGYGGPVDAFLSWKGFAPLSRLTYCAYLLHPIVITLQVYSRRTLEHWSDIELIYRFIGHICITYASAFVISLAFESPMIGLEKCLLGRKKNN